ncbi:flagellar hook-basal body complex protein [Methylobacter sp.]|uniref:flagellar hook-basal body complex protein n=1 Tax=Methylobacter sp. TaxID=2051955 RepID=UPI002FDCACE7
MGFATALSGLKAASASLQVTGNNIANSQTTGFKESRAEFADVYASSIGGVSKTQPGAGVRVTEVAQQFNQGNIESTQNSLDLAVSGNGFFVLADSVNLPDPNNPSAPVNPSVPSAYTRNGAFKLDSTGNVVNSEGKYLLAFAPNGATAEAGFSVGVFRPLTIDTAQGLPNATANVDMKLNINGAASVPSASLFDPLNPLSYNNTTSITTYDTQGNAHIVSTYYVKTPVANAWNAYVFLDNFGITTGGAPIPPAAAPASTVSSTINTPGTPIPMTFNASGLLAEVGVRAAGVISAGTVTAANKTVADTTAAKASATALPTIYTDAATSATATTASTAAVTTAVTSAATASSASTAAASNPLNAAAVATLAGNAFAAAGTADGLVAAITAASAAIPSAAPFAAIYATASANALTSASNYKTAADAYALSLDTVTDGPNAAAAGVTAAADAILAQTALNNYKAAVAAAVNTAKQAAVSQALVGSSSATALAAAASAVNTVPSAATLAATAKTTAATAAASAVAYATAAAAVVDVATANTAAGLAAIAAADAATAQTAANAYDTAVSAVTSGAPQETKVDFGSINLGLINPNASVAPMAFDLDFFGSTQFATPFSVNGLKQDGLPAGNLTGIDVDGTGVVFARYSNGGSKPLGQVALARFQSNQSLAKVGDTTWAQTSSSGQPIYGAAGDNNFGAIQSSALEGSNVDLSDQLVKLIIAQQAYQANSQTITTEKTLIQTILNA